jgi:hypothetical protein
MVGVANTQGFNVVEELAHCRVGLVFNFLDILSADSGNASYTPSRHPISE